MKVEPWMKALAKEEGFFGKCCKHDAGDRSYNLFCVKCLTKVSPCCQAAHKGHNLLLIKRASCQDAVARSDLSPIMDCSDIQVANINSKDIVYIGHHLSSTYAPLARNNFMGCSERRTPGKAGPTGRIPSGEWTYCSVACKIAGLTRVEPRVQMSVRVRSSVGVGGNALTSPASTQRKSKPKPARGRA